MKGRWWAPTSPRIGPDNTDLALLAPGGEARYDLGAALFALHRTGAAACEVVAASPIPDQYSLIEALASARTGLADPLVDCVSKCVEGESYAGLLVRDLADEAEEGALHVFNTAVSKGVPAPVAAQRAGLVYGVPKQELGKFLSLACDLRAHPAALTDAADRVLFAHVEKVCSEEVTDDKEEVSKQTAVLERTQTQPRRQHVLEEHPTRTRRGVFVEAEHVRDTEGRFASKTGSLSERLGLTDLAPSAVTVRQPRTARKARVARKTSEAKTELKLQTMLSPGKLNARLKLSPMQLKQVLAAGTKLKPKAEFADDLMKPIPTNKKYGRIDGDLNIALPSADWQQMLGKMPGSGSWGDEKRFRMGYLTEALKEGALPEPTPADSVASHQSLAEVAGVMRTDPDAGEAPDAVHFSQEDIIRLGGWGHPALEEAIAEATTNMVKSHLEREGYDESSPEWDSEFDRLTTKIHSGMLQGEEPDSIVLLNDEGSDTDDLTVVRFHVIGDIRGNDFDVPAGHAGGGTKYAERGRGGAGASGDLELDPNQAFKIIDQQDPDHYYDAKRGVHVLTYLIKPLDDESTGQIDEVGKAAQVLERQRTHVFVETEHPRDTEGRFATSRTLAPPVQAKPRQARVARKARVARQPEKVESGLALQATNLKVPLSQVKVKPLSSKLRNKIKAAYQPNDKPAHDPLPGVPRLLNDVNYKVFSPEGLRYIFDLAGYKHNEGTRVPARLPLDSHVKDFVTAGLPYDGDEANEAMKGIADELIWHAAGTRQPQFRRLNAEPVPINTETEAGRAAWKRVINQYFEDNQDVTQILIQPVAGVKGFQPEDEYADDQESLEEYLARTHDESHVDLLGNAQQVEPLAIVEYADDFDPDSPDAELHYIGTFRSNNLHDDSLHESEQDAFKRDQVLNAPVRMFKLTGPTVHMYGLRNPEHQW